MTVTAMMRLMTRLLADPFPFTRLQIMHQELAAVLLLLLLLLLLILLLIFLLLACSRSWRTSPSNRCEAQSERSTAFIFQ